MFGKLGVLAQIALRNLRASWINVIIGFVILGGTFLVVVLGSALDSLNASMTKSVTQSLSGDLQVYSADSKDTLKLFGDIMGADPDIEPIQDFSRLEKLVESVPNVREVVPMGSHSGIITSGNIIDVMLEKLRAAVNRTLSGDASPEAVAKAKSLEQHVRHIVEILKKDRARAQTLIERTADEDRADEAIARASSDEFWAQFDKEPLAALEFLENHIAPLLSDGDLLFIRYTGTDLDKFRRAFDTMEIVDGQMVPSGRRGLLLPKFLYEEQFKVKTARRLDKIKEAREAGGKTIATDPELKRFVKENVTQTQSLLFQLDPLATRQAIARLQKSLGSSEADLGKLLEQLLETDDQNFEERYRIFYADIAPLLEMYRVRVGDVVTVRAYSGSGYMESANLKLYGTFNFRGLEKSPLAGFTSLTDLQTFRELYGYLNAERRAEIEQIKQSSGVKDVSREDAEAALFGGSAGLVEEGRTASIDEAEHLGRIDPASRGVDERAYTQAEIDEGIVLSTAVMLNDPRQHWRTKAAIAEAAEKSGLRLRVASWQEATGVFGEFVTYVRYAMYLIATIIFLVAMVILSNAVLMATLQRVREIGTMRAIGAQRGFVRAMIVIETVVLGTAFGGIGLLVGCGVVALVGQIGVPAFTEELYFFFAGPRWFPDVSGRQVIAAYAIVLVVSVISTLYPALIATRVAPVEAMGSEE
ncbi:MAG TPA: FtsX-like permease family protein [Myxococcaceae bacterium]|nr:FtsX-like permease family protein [Myxococcaceae bacterium]